MFGSGGDGGFRSSRSVPKVAISTLVLLSLVGCTEPDPEAPREDSLTAIEQALQSGSGSDFCMAVNTVVPNTCVDVILDSSGLEGAEFREFPISESSSTHIIEVSGFKLEMASTLFEFDSGPEYVFTLTSFVIPSVSTVFGGTLDGVSLLPGQTYDVMPASAPGNLVADAPSHGFLTSSVSTSPWINTYKTELTWSSDVEELAIAESERECQAILALGGYDIFSRYSGFMLRSQSNFQKAATWIRTFYLDGTNHERDARYVNSPSNLVFGQCEVQKIVKGENAIEVDWLAKATFDGTVGVQTERRSFFDDYTGEYQDRTFSTLVAGTSLIKFSQDQSELSVSALNINAGMPMTSEKR